MSKKNFKKVFKFWSILKAGEIAKWLENQAAKGWILQNKGLSIHSFYFKKDEPTKIKFGIHYKFMQNRATCELDSSDSEWAIYKKWRSWRIVGKEYGETEPDNVEIQRSSLRSYKMRSFLLCITAFSLLMGSIFSLTGKTDIYEFSTIHYILTGSLIGVIYSLWRMKKITEATTGIIEKRSRKYRKVFRFWLAWNSDKIEKWLEEQAAEGWILKDINFNLTNFWFEKSEPSKISFATDFQNRPEEEYFMIAKDSGWKNYSTNCGWHLWSKEYESHEKPVFFSDNSSLIKKFTRILAFLGIIVAYEYVVLLTTISKFIETDSIITRSICVLHFLVTILVTWIVAKIIMKINSLKRDNRYQEEQI